MTLLARSVLVAALGLAPGSPLSTAQEAVDGVDAPALFARHCAMCHGERGRGDGPAAPYLEPAPRGFQQGSFLLVSTENRVPTDEDLAGAIARGLPGSAMPAWSHLGETRVTALARFVRTLAVEEAARDLAEVVVRPGTAVDLEPARREARDRLTPGPVLDPGPEAPANAVTLAQGRALYQARCAVCHGQDGAGPAFPRTPVDFAVRDLRDGILKGEATHAALVRRIVLGLPGSAMPQGLLNRDEAALVVAWLKHDVLPADVDVRQVQRQATLTAARLAGPLPTHGADPRWERIPALAVRLAPLRWSAPSLRHASLQAVHDGDALAVRVRWRDETRNDHLLATAPFSDGVALQFARTEAPAFQGMGRSDGPSSIWHWKSFRVDRTAGFLDLLGRSLHGASVDASAEDYRPAPGILSVDEEARSLSSEDLGHLRDLERRGVLVSCHPTWHQGTWDVVFTRSLATGSAEEVAFEPNAPLWISLALWNGAAEEFGPRKSVSLWHAFELTRD